MSAYQEFAIDVERRRKRLAWRQFWAVVRLDWNRHRDFWTLAFVTLLVLGFGAVLAKVAGY